MQSILQYRRFRRRLEEQIQRHGAEKVAACPEAHATERIAPSSLSNRPISTLSSDGKDCALEEKDTENETPYRSSDVPVESVRDDETHTTVIPGHFNQRATVPNISGSTIQSRSSSASSLRSEPTGLHTTSTNASAGVRLGQTLTGVNVRTRQTNERGPDGGKIFIVGFQGDDDPFNPHNWSRAKRICVTIFVAKIGFIVGLASSVDSPAARRAAEEFGVSEVVESLSTALYLIGFGFGAFFAAPFSETVGRNPVYLFTMGFFMIFLMASALAPNIASQLVFRLLAGFFGSTPLTCAGGSLSDMWSASERTLFFPLFGNFAFWGPILGPVIGGFIAQSSSLSWRWTDWITLIWTGVIFVVLVLFLPETYGPTLLKWKAFHLRSITGDERYMSGLEVQDVKFINRLIHNFYRPFLMFFQEPIVILFTLYLTVVYIVLFTFLTGFEFVFAETYNLSLGITYLIFISLGVGFFFATALVPTIVKRYRSALHAANEKGISRLPPEQRLIFAMIGAPFLPLGLFWMGWTTYPSISVWSPIAACVPMGFGILMIFLSTYQYLIDAFETHAASALVAITFIRYVVCGAMVPVSIPWYRNMGVHYTLTILGAIAALMAPVPYLFWIYGARIRKLSRYATDFA